MPTFTAALPMNVSILQVVVFCVVLCSGCYTTVLLSFLFLPAGQLSSAGKKSIAGVPCFCVICARDEAVILPKTFPASCFNNYRTTHEVIVVNDNSMDETKYILEEFKKTFKDLVIIPLMQEAIMIPGKKFPLSIGIKSTQHEVLILTDADCVPASEFWMQKMQEAYSPGIEIVLGYGAYQKKNGLHQQTDPV